MNIALIKISGTDAEKFLQGQLSVDVTQLDSDKATLAAHCNPKGRVVSLFWIFRADDKFYLSMPTDLLPIALANLKKYGIFFRTVTIETIDNVDIIPANAKQNRLEKIRAGIPTLYAATSEIFLPHDLNLPQLGAVSFTKGCYTGQEIIARMEHLGKPKQHLYKIKFDADVAPQAGEKIFLENNLQSEVGHIVDTVAVEDHIEALAVLKDSAVDNKKQVQLVIGEILFKCTV